MEFKFNLNKLLNIFPMMSSEEFAKKRAINNSHFFIGIQNNDISLIEESLNKGLGLDIEKWSFWEHLINVDESTTKNETYEFLLKQNFADNILTNARIRDVISNLQMEKGIHIAYDPNIRSSYLIKETIKQKILKNLKSEKIPFDELLFFTANNHVDASKINNYKSDIFNKIGKGDISQLSDKFHKYITDNMLVPHLFHGLSNQKSLDFFLTSPYYEGYFKNYSNETRGGFMDYALSIGQINKVKTLNQLGVSLFNEPKSSKSAYSKLFMMNHEEGNAIQNYVLSNIGDVTIGNHVILKTLLHVTSYTPDHEHKIKLINTVLEGYSDNQIDLVPGLLIKRPKTERVLFVEKYYAHRILKMELRNELDPSINNQSNKRLKL